MNESVAILNPKISAFSKDIGKFLGLLDKEGTYKDLLTSTQVHTLFLAMERAELGNIVNSLPVVQSFLSIGNYFECGGYTFIEAFCRTPIKRYIEQFNETRYAQKKESPYA